MSERVEALWAMHATGHHLSRDAIEELFKAHDSALADARLLAVQVTRLVDDAATQNLILQATVGDEAHDAYERHSPAADAPRSPAKETP